jgi:hypothetical protein
VRRLLFAFALAAGLLALLAAPALASAKTFYVSPSGGNDTHNIQAAFNAAVAAGPGSTVQLSAGHFYTNTIVVQNFDGTLKGAGEGQTVIDTLRGNPKTPDALGVALTDPNDPAASLEPFPSLINFDGGTVSVSGMSFDITSASPAAPFLGYGNQADATFLWSVVLVTGNASSAFNQVSFTAHSGNEYDFGSDGIGFNLTSGIAIMGKLHYDPSQAAAVLLEPTGGSQSITHCLFGGDAGLGGAGFEGVIADGLTGGRLTASGNVVNAYYGGIFLWDNSNSDIAVCDNQVQCSYGEGIWVFQGWITHETGGPLPVLPAPHYLISDNHILATQVGYGGAGGVALEDDSAIDGSSASRLDAVVSDNTITLNNGGFSGGIDGIFGQDKGVLIAHNQIAGNGAAGIDLGTPWFWGYTVPAGLAGWKLIDNDVSGVIPADAYGDPTAQIVLGSGASDCLVVGGPPPTTVLDQGTDDTLINVTLVSDPPAAAATPMNSSAQMKQLKGMMLP